MLCSMGRRTLSDPDFVWIPSQRSDVILDSSSKDSIETVDNREVTKTNGAGGVSL